MTSQQGGELCVTAFAQAKEREDVGVDGERTSPDVCWVHA